MKKYIDLEIEYKKNLLQILESINSITIKDEEGNTKVVYVKKGIEQYMNMEDINGKATS